MTNDKRVIVAGDPWNKLRQYTPARIALGHAGTSMPTKPHLEFQLAHARARDAVHHELDIPALQAALQSRGMDAILLHSGAESRPHYLQRPDKGRRLDADSRATLETPRARRTPMTWPSSSATASPLSPSRRTPPSFSTP